MKVFNIMKTVKFKGVKFPIPCWAEYLTIDGDGTIEAWSEKPVLGDNESWSASPDSEFLYVGWCEGSSSFEPECVGV